MLKNISNITSYSSTHRGSHLYGNKSVGNVSNSNQQRIEKLENVSEIDSLQINISDEARKAALQMIKEKHESDKLKNELGKMQSMINVLELELENMKNPNDGNAESIKVLTKCILIAARIMQGDEVPKEDLKFLQKNNMELYYKSIMMRVEKKNPKKHERISEDEKPPESTNTSIDTADIINTLQSALDNINMSGMETSNNPTNSEIE